MAVSYLMLATMFFNTLIGPAYFVNLGTGRARLNAQAQLVIAGMNLTAGLLLGYMFSGTGVVVSYALAILIGSGYLIARFLLLQNLTTRALLPNGMLGPFLSITVASLISGIPSFALQDGMTTTVVTVLAFVLLTIFVWTSPEPRDIWAQLRCKRQPQDAPGGTQ